MKPIKILKLRKKFKKKILINYLKGFLLMKCLFKKTKTRNKTTITSSFSQTKYPLSFLILMRKKQIILMTVNRDMALKISLRIILLMVINKMILFNSRF